MGLSDHIAQVFRTLRARFFESTLIIVGIGLGIGVIASLIALLEGFTEMRSEYLSRRDFQIIRVMPGGRRFVLSEEPVRLIGESIPEPVVLKLEDLDGFKLNCPAIKYGFVERYQSFQIQEGEPPRPTEPIRSREEMEAWEKKRAEYYLDVIGTVPDFFAFYQLSLERGAFFVEEDVKKGSQVMILSSSLARRFFGDEDPVGRVMTIPGGGTYTIIGVMRAIPEEEQEKDYKLRDIEKRGIVPFTSLGDGNRALSGSAIEEVGELLLAPGDIEGMEEATEQVSAYIEREYEGRLNLFSVYAVQKTAEALMRKIMMGIGAFASVGLLIAAINILNLMMARTLQRMKGIGISLALGADRRTILFSFLYESLSLGILGGVLGVGLSFGGARLLSMLVGGAPVLMNLRVISVGLGTGIGVSLLFGVYPAIQASHVNPVDALRME